MTEQTIIKIEAIIEYIETHLNEKLSLDTVATAVHYSKYHLSRLFFDTVGLHLNDYVKRRQLTEAAKLLIFPKIPLLTSPCFAAIKVSNPLRQHSKACTKPHRQNIVQIAISILYNCALHWKRIHQKSLLPMQIFA